MTSIKLYKKNGVWIARTDDPQFIDLFGSADLPTAFRADADISTVLHTIQRLNPGASVSFL